MRRMMLWLLLAASCSAYAANDAWTRPGLHESETLQVGGVTREFSYYVPDHAAGKALPLVIYLHGHGDNLRHVTGKGRVPSPGAQWMSVAEREKVLVVYPLGVIDKDKLSGWNDCRNDVDSHSHADDIEFIKALIAHAEQHAGIDRKRIYVTGMSNGGFMTLRIAMEMSAQIAAAAAAAAFEPRHSKCAPPTRPVPILFMHGTNDPITPFAGGAVANGRGMVHSARETVDFWRGWNGVQALPAKTRQLPDRDTADGSVIVEHAWTNAAGAVVWYEIQGAGHTEPSRSAKLPRMLVRFQGRQNGDVEMADTVWAFFARYALDR